jgi:hypothetical protein
MAHQQPLSPMGEEGKKEKKMRTRRLRFMALMAVGLVVGWVGLAPTRSSEAGWGKKFPATGQTTCYDSSGSVITCAGTGQDGDIQAGATLSYTDKGDGTIKDRNTGLIWEKKSDDGTIHDLNTTYTWANAFDVHIAGLNEGSGFAGHTDWRLPNVKELQSIIDYENEDNAVALAFYTGCVPGITVLTGSCTQGSFYWSSTSYASSPDFAWGVDFYGGTVSADFKSYNHFVRAVRGGL